MIRWMNGAFSFLGGREEHGLVMWLVYTVLDGDVDANL